MARSPYALDGASLARMLDSTQSAIIRYDRAGCVDCGALNPFFENINFIFIDIFFSKNKLSMEISFFNFVIISNYYLSYSA